MKDPAEQLIRRALGRRPPPTLGPTFAEDVLRRVTAPPPPAASPRVALWRLVLLWLTAVVASVTVLALVEWSAATRTVAWALALVTVPLAYSATLWPGGALRLLALCSGASLGARREKARAGQSP